VALRTERRSEKVVSEATDIEEPTFSSRVVETALPILIMHLRDAALPRLTKSSEEVAQVNRAKLFTENSPPTWEFLEVVIVPLMKTFDPTESEAVVVAAPRMDTKLPTRAKFRSDNEDPILLQSTVES